MPVRIGSGTRIGYAKMGGSRWTPLNLPGLDLYGRSDRLGMDGTKVVQLNNLAGGAVPVQTDPAKQATVSTNVFGAKPALHCVANTHEYVTPPVDWTTVHNATLFVVFKNYVADGYLIGKYYAGSQEDLTIASGWPTTKCLHIQSKSTGAVRAYRSESPATLLESAGAHVLIVSVTEANAAASEIQGWFDGAPITWNPTYGSYVESAGGYYNSAIRVGLNVGADLACWGAMRTAITSTDRVAFEQYTKRVWGTNVP